MGQIYQLFLAEHLLILPVLHQHGQLMGDLSDVHGDIELNAVEASYNKRWF